MNIKILFFLILFIAGISSTSCNKMLDTSPTNTISENIVYNQISMLDALLQATYSRLKNAAPEYMNNGAVNIKTLATSYGSDMNTNPNPTYGNMLPLKNASFYQPESYLPTEYAPRGLWREYYAVIYNTNLILANIDGVSGETAKKNAIKGQALAIRGRCYYNLIRFYQHTYSIASEKPGVPLLLTPGIKTSVARSTVQEVYAQIVSDLESAETLLADYQRPSIAFYDKDVAAFLLADVYLTMNDWPKAEAYANKIRVKYALMTLEDYQAGFTTVNREWVLGYEQTNQDFSTENLAEFYDFGQAGTTLPYYCMYPSAPFIALMQGDPRSLYEANPILQSRYASRKFRERQSSAPYGAFLDLRAAEMYLVEAEAAARQGKTGEALAVLNMIQNARPGAAVTTATNQDDLISAILLERRKEMYGEGLDYFDIKRLQLPVEKSIAQGHEVDLSLPSNSNRLTLMIPDQEMLNNKMMVQNPDPAVVPVYIR